MPISGVHIETTHAPAAYTEAQVARMCLVAAMMDRGPLVVVEEPRNDCLIMGAGCELCMWLEEHEYEDG